MAIKANLVIDQGTDFSATIDVKTATGQNYDLTNHLVRAHMRKNTYSSDYFGFICTHTGVTGQITLKMTSGTADGVTESGTRGTEGYVHPQPSQPGTKAISAGRYLYDVEIESNETPTKISRVVEGTITVTPGITKES